MGFFSFKTDDTKESIWNRYSGHPVKAVYLVNPLTGEYWKESSYDGYGEFGGKDIFVLAAEMNGATGTDEEKRDFFFEDYYGRFKAWKLPALVTALPWDRFGAMANCPNQGYFDD